MLEGEEGRDQKALKDIEELMDMVSKIKPDTILSAQESEKLANKLAKVFNDIADTNLSPMDIMNKNPDKMFGLVDSERDELKGLKEMLKKVFQARERAEHMPKIQDGLEILKWLVNNYQMKDKKIQLTKKEVIALEDKLTLVVKDFGPDLVPQK